MGQGRSISDQTLRRIIQLLSSTDMAIKEIAERMSCSHTAVLSINRKYQIRLYGGFRSQWRTGIMGGIDATAQASGLDGTGSMIEMEKESAQGI